RHGHEDDGSRTTRAPPRYHLACRGRVPGLSPAAVTGLPRPVLLRTPALRHVSRSSGGSPVMAGSTPVRVSIRGGAPAVIPVPGRRPVVAGAIRRAPHPLGTIGT